MPYFEFNNIKISGISAAVPSKEVFTEDYKTRFGEKLVEKFISTTGVISHRETLIHQTASDLAFVAAENILKEKEICRESIGAIIFVAHSTDYRRPATACVLQKRLGLSKDCVAYDMNLGCSAPVYGLLNLASIMNSSNIKKALLLVGETLSKCVSNGDKSSMIFGDGGAAILLEKVDSADKMAGVLKSDGNRYKSIIMPAGGYRNMHAPTEEMLWQDGNTRSLYNTNMNGDGVFSFAISDVSKTIKEFLSVYEMTADDFDCFAFHQANLLIQNQIAKKIGADKRKMPVSIDKYGNTSAASIPLTLCDAFGNEETERDIKTLMCGFGVGLSWGVVSLNINSKDIFPVIITDEYFEEGVINSPDDL